MVVRPYASGLVHPRLDQPRKERRWDVSEPLPPFQSTSP